MSATDARYLKREVQEYLRQQAIRLRGQGKGMAEIGAFLGVHRNTVSRWCKLYQQSGADALVQSARGRAVGTGRHLSAEAEIDIPNFMLEHFPEDLHIDSALWTRRSVQALIAEYCGIEMPIRTVGSYLQRWGFTPQKPLQRAYEQDPAAVEAWLQRDYPALEQRAKTEAGEIAWGDESGLRSQDQGGRGFGLKGETPVTNPTQKQHYRINFIASINRQGRVQFMLYRQKFTGSLFITFLKRLLQGRKHKLFWVVDRHPVHRAQQVQQWLAKHQDQIELIFLPAYSPQLNPTEYLNGDVKQDVKAKAPCRTQPQLEQRLRSRLFHLQKLPDKVKRFFQHPEIAYAA